MKARCYYNTENIGTIYKNREARRHHSDKDYFSVTVRIYKQYQLRIILNTDVRICTFFSSRKRHDEDSVKMSLEFISKNTGVCVDTVIESIKRLESAGFIWHTNAGFESYNKKAINEYFINQFEDDSYILVPRSFFKKYDATRFTHNMFAMAVFMCFAQSKEYNLSWNSYNELCDKLGYSRNSRSYVMETVKALNELGVIKKRVRKNAAGAFIDNIYIVIGYAKEVSKRVMSAFHWKHVSKFEKIFDDYERQVPLSVWSGGKRHREIDFGMWYFFNISGVKLSLCNKKEKPLRQASPNTIYISSSNTYKFQSNFNIDYGNCQPPTQILLNEFTPNPCGAGYDGYPF